MKYTSGEKRPFQGEGVRDMRGFCLFYDTPPSSFERNLTEVSYYWKWRNLFLESES